MTINKRTLLFFFFSKSLGYTLMMCLLTAVLVDEICRYISKILYVYTIFLDM